MNIDDVITNVPTNGYLETRVRSALVISPMFRVMMTTPKPNAWWRFWYWALLGWRWEDVA